MLAYVCDNNTKSISLYVCPSPSLPQIEWQALNQEKRALFIFSFNFFNQYLLNHYRVQARAREKGKAATFFGAMVAMLTCVPGMEVSYASRFSVHRIMQMNQEPTAGSPSVIHPTWNNPSCELYLLSKYCYRETKLRLSFYKNKSIIFTVITTLFFLFYKK